MARRAVVRLDAEGIDRLVKSIEPDALYHKPLIDLLDWGRREGERHAKGRAPVGSGRLAGSITSALRASGTPPHGVISFSRVQSDDGFRYPFALNSSRKFRRSVAVAGAGRGRPTYKWFTGVLSLIRKAIRSRSKATDAAVAANWKGR